MRKLILVGNSLVITVILCILIGCGGMNTGLDLDNQGPSRSGSSKLISPGGDDSLERLISPGGDDNLGRSLLGTVTRTASGKTVAPGGDDNLSRKRRW